MKAELVKVKGEMQTMDRKMADEIGTVRGEMTELKGSVKGVWSAMETGKEEVTDRITTVGREVDKLGQGMKEIKKGQGQLKAEIGKNTAAIQNLKQGQQEAKGELEAVKEGCKMRHEEMTEMVKEMGRKVETESQELGERLKKHEDETKKERSKEPTRSGVTSAGALHHREPFFRWEHRGYHSLNKK